MGNVIGQSIGRYHILEQLGEGGMAIVYKAYDTRLECHVAIKFIRTEKLTPETTGKTRHRFEREARTLANLTHPNIVSIIDFGEYESQPYLVMPFLPGGTLKHKLTGRPIPYQTAAKTLLPIARALDYAHKQKMIHRDVKPSNILLTESGEPMLSDFGVAKILEEDATADITGTGVGIGTPEYMAPEQAEKSIDHRADIYSLGTVLYELVTGRKPYKADTPLAVLIKRASEPLPRPKKFVPNLPNHVEQVLLKVLAKNPSDRYLDAGAFANVLEKLATEPERKPGVIIWSPIFVSTTLAVLVLFAGLFITFQSGMFLTKTPPPLGDQTAYFTLVMPETSSSKTPTRGAVTNTPQLATPTIKPTIILEPQFDPDDPEGFLRWYFHSVWSDRNYQVLWDYNSDEFRSRLNINYPQFVENWENVGSIDEPISISFDRKDGNTLVYRMKFTTRSRKSGFTDTQDVGYYLYFNTLKGHWEFK